MNKKEYVKASLQIIYMTFSDIISTSVEVEGKDNDSSWNGEWGDLL